MSAAAVDRHPDLVNRCWEIHDGDTVLVRVGNDPTGRRITDVPVVLHLEGDTIVLDVYLHNGDSGPDRSLRLPIADLEAGWSR